MPCARCAYNLRGLSILGKCPECALPVRATLLAKLDPRADELQPITNPRFTAWGVVAWSTSALVAAVITWVLRAADAFSARLPGDWVGRGQMLMMLCVVLSGLGAIALIRPHGGDQVRRGLIPALLGTILYLPLLWLLRGLMEMDTIGADPYSDEAAHGGRRLLYHALSVATIIVQLHLLRPNARLLAARSLLMRTGRVDRQTMRSVAAVLLVVLLGDGMRLAGWSIPGGTGVLVDQAGRGLVLVGSVLFTIGLFGIAVDCWRLAPVILDPPLSLAQALGPERPARTEPSR
ncbi:MAG: hypothetical protein HBSAPP03_22010 [Phycisphaerae bacterium]|nr:MAG: hypothetical protein HBSAPP03_22010 [Phycisphaerae bacterium]